MLYKNKWSFIVFTTLVIASTLIITFYFAQKPDPHVSGHVSREVDMRVRTDSENNKPSDLKMLKTEKPVKSYSGNYYYSEYEYGLINDLLEIAKEDLTSEMIVEINRILELLRSRGISAISAIRRFLDKKEDINFINVTGDTGLNEYDSLRLALFDILRQSGGVEAEQALLGELLSTGDSVEFGILMKYLEELSPGSYWEDGVKSALERLQMIAEGQLHNQDVGPLLHVLQSYGGPYIVADIEKYLSDWGIYANIALAGLQDGAGIPSLIKLVENLPEETTGLNVFSDIELFSLQMLAQTAITDLKAHNALLAQASSDRIPESLWPWIASSVTGDSQFQIEKPDIDLSQSIPYSSSSSKKYPYSTHKIGNSVIYSVHRSALLSEEEINSRINLIDELLSVSDDPTAVKELNNARSLLTGNI